MPNEAQIREGLKDVLVPGVRRSLLQLNLVRNVTIADATVDIALASAAMNPGAQEWLRAAVTEAVKGLGDIDEVTISFVEAKPAELNQIRRVVAVMNDAENQMAIALNAANKSEHRNAPNSARLYGLTNPNNRQYDFMSYIFP